MVTTVLLLLLFRKAGMSLLLKGQESKNFVVVFTLEVEKMNGFLYGNCDPSVSKKALLFFFTLLS